MGRLSNLAKLEVPEWELELAMALLRGNVSVTEVQITLDKRNPGGVYSWALCRLQIAYKLGRLLDNDTGRVL